MYWPLGHEAGGKGSVQTPVEYSHSMHPLSGHGEQESEVGVGK